MKKNTLLIAGALIIVVLAFAFLQDKIMPEKTGPTGKYDAFAQCLTEKGATMYGAWWCGHCSNQKMMFGDSFKYINYIECSTKDRSDQTDACKFAGVTGYPTWDINGERTGGEVSFETLSNKTGCELPKE